MRAIRATVTALNFEFLMADILKKQRNLTSTTFKKMASYKANRPFRDFTHQNKNSKRIESSKLSNRRRKPDRGFNYNTHPKEDEEASKDVETEFESDLNPKLESFICVIRNFDLDDSKSSCFTSSLNFNNNVEDSKTKGGYLTAFNKSKKSLKRSSNRPNLLLYDIGVIDHIINDRKWFRDDYILNRG